MTEPWGWLMPGVYIFGTECMLLDDQISGARVKFMSFPSRTGLRHLEIATCGGHGSTLNPFLVIDGKFEAPF